MSEARTSDGRLPLGCRLGFWHTWSRWTDYDTASEFTPDKDMADGKLCVAKLLIQRRQCKCCSASQFRRAYM